MSEESIITKVTQDLDKVSKDSLLPGVPNTALPSPEFMEQVKRIEDSQKQKQASLSQPTTPQIISVPIVEPVRESIPIQLEYKYTGTCDNCHTVIDTILTEVEKITICIAWCNICKKSLQQQKVKPLRKEEVYGNNEHETRIPKPEKVRKVSEKKKISV